MPILLKMNKLLSHSSNMKPEVNALTNCLWYSVTAIESLE